MTYRERWGHERTHMAKGLSHRQQRRIEAEARQKVWDSFTVGQKIEVLKKRPGNCQKQLARLTV